MPKETTCEGNGCNSNADCCSTDSKASDTNGNPDKKRSKLDDLGQITLAQDFTPSTPYVHKFRTEMCKNWELYGKCKYGD